MLSHGESQENKHPDLILLPPPDVVGALHCPTQTKFWGDEESLLKCLCSSVFYTNMEERGGKWMLGANGRYPVSLGPLESGSDWQEEGIEL